MLSLRGVARDEAKQSLPLLQTIYIQLLQKLKISIAIKGTSYLLVASIPRNDIDRLLRSTTFRSQ